MSMTKEELDLCRRTAADYRGRGMPGVAACIARLMMELAEAERERGEARSAFVDMSKAAQQLVDAVPNTLILLEQNKVMRAALKDIYENWDCDYARRGHHPQCRSCAAEVALK